MSCLQICCLVSPVECQVHMRMYHLPDLLGWLGTPLHSEPGMLFPTPLGCWHFFKSPIAPNRERPLSLTLLFLYTSLTGGDSTPGERAQLCWHFFKSPIAPNRERPLSLTLLYDIFPRRGVICRPGSVRSSVGRTYPPVGGPLACYMDLITIISMPSEANVGTFLAVQTTFSS